MGVITGILQISLNLADISIGFGLISISGIPVYFRWIGALYNVGTHTIEQGDPENMGVDVEILVISRS